MSMVFSHSMVCTRLKVGDFSLLIYVDSGSRPYILNRKKISKIAGKTPSAICH